VSAADNKARFESMSDELLKGIRRQFGQSWPCRGCRQRACILPESVCFIRAEMDAVPVPETTWLGRFLCRVFYHPWHVTEGWLRNPIAYRYCFRCGSELREERR